MDSQYFTETCRMIECERCRTTASVFILACSLAHDCATYDVVRGCVHRHGGVALVAHVKEV
jgi:hypothetical protein